MADQPLAGITVLDFSTLLPGPLATLMLAEAGARVIKIERPGGEDMRRFPPHVAGAGVLYTLLNRGKERIELDLRDPAARARALDMAREADVVVEQFRPGVMGRLGLDAAALQAVNPRLVVCSITGFGQDGPRAPQAGHDLTYLALTGLLSLSHGSAQAPVLPPAQIADIAGGSFPAVINILLALLARERTGRGAVLDIAMTEAMFTFALFAIARHAAEGRAPANGADLLTGGSPRYGVYPTADGGLVAVAALEEKFWQALCDVVGLDPALRDDRHDPAATRAGLAARLAGAPLAHWAPRLAAADCCACPVASLEEALADPQVAARGLFAREVVAGGLRLPALPVPIVPAFRGAQTLRAAPES